MHRGTVDSTERDRNGVRQENGADGTEAGLLLLDQTVYYFFARELRFAPLGGGLGQEGKPWQPANGGGRTDTAKCAFTHHIDVCR